MTDINELRNLLNEHPNGWNVSFECNAWVTIFWSIANSYDLFISHPLLEHNVGLRKYLDNPDNHSFHLSIFGFASYYDYNIHHKGLLSLIEDMIEMPISEFTDGVFDYVP